MKTNKEKSIESVIGVNLGIPDNTNCLMVFSAKNVIAAYENEAKEILRRNGYPVTLEELWKRKEELLPDLENGKGLSQIYDIFWMLWNLEVVKTCVDKCDADQAVCFMASALYWATVARLGPIKPTVTMGKTYSLLQSKKGSKRRKTRGITPQERDIQDQKIIADFKNAKSKNPRITPHGFANNNEKKYKTKYSIGTSRVRQIIYSHLNN